MLIPPKYFLTVKIVKLLTSIEASKEVIDSISIPTEVEHNIRRKSTLRSSLFSARIEGNNISIDDFPRLASNDQKKIEVQNVLRAINWIYERAGRDVTVKDILTLHEISMKGIVGKDELGKFRKSHEGIFNAGGFVIYHAPLPSMVPKLIERLVKFINSSKEPIVPARAALTHFTFEKIHPFVDGSGRVGRLLMLLVLSKGGYGMNGVLPFEEEIDKKRESYYKALESSERDVTDYLEFMLETVATASENAKRLILEKQKVSPTDFLLPRRAELLNIVKDQKLVNFDSIRRRFPAVNQRTLRYDLKKLADSGFIKKLGATNGVYYQSID